jgi:CheY-like chemotaxis protein
LFSIQQRLNYLGGRIEIDSAPGKGSRIVMFLPADTAAATSVEEKGPAETVPILNQTPPAPVRVMVVDDHKVMRDGLSTMLRLEPGLRVIGEAEDGEEAVEKVRSLQPHVILMDVTMPKMDGVEATRIIHQQFPTIKIIGLSMHTDPRISESMKQAGAVAYLTKGDPIEKVIEAIELNVQPIR